MNIVFGFIILVILLFIVLISSILYSILNKTCFQERPLWSPELQRRMDELQVMGNHLKELANKHRSTTEIEEEAARVKQEADMIEYARNKLKNIPPPHIRSSATQSERLITKRSKSNELVPFGMSDSDKKLWEEFNS